MVAIAVFASALFLKTLRRYFLKLCRGDRFCYWIIEKMLLIDERYKEKLIVSKQQNLKVEIVVFSDKYKNSGGQNEFICRKNINDYRGYR